MTETKTFMIWLTIWFVDGTITATPATMMEAIRLEQADELTVKKFDVQVYKETTNV